MLIDPPPYDLAPGVETAAHIAFGAGAIVVLVYVVRLARFTGKRYPTYLYLGASIVSLYEVIADRLAQVTWPHSELPLYHLMGRTIPLYALGMYLVYFGFASTWLMSKLDNGVSFRTWWRGYFLHVLGCLLFELIPLHYGLWRYWGDNQSVGVGGMPAWWWFINCAMLMNSTAVMHLLRKHKVIAEKQTWQLFLLYPMLIMGLHMSTSWPMFLAINSTQNELLTNAAALGCIGLAVLETRLLGRLIAADRPESTRTGPGLPIASSAEAEPSAALPAPRAIS